MSTSPTLQTTTLRSNEFSCPSCVSKIETKLGGMPGVEKAEVKFSSGRIIVTHDPEKVGVRELVDAVAQVGYAAVPSSI